jgi:photosystem II stability/assembly factor-like uncharacterized protein
MSDRLLVGSRKGLFVYALKDASWHLHTQHFLGKPVSAICVSGAQWWVALNEGHFGPKLHTSPDAGATWSQLSAPAFPQGMDGEPSVEQIWCLSGNAQQLWAGCIPAGLFQSRDGGQSWELNKSLWSRPERSKWFGGGYDHAGIHSVLVDPRDPQVLVLGISCGGVWRTDDAGHNWENRSQGMWAAYMPPDRKEDPDVQDPHRIAQCAADPDVLWCQHHNGQFVSNDGQGRWREIWPQEPLSNFGFTVVAHPINPHTAWFVPAEADERRVPLEGDFCVLRTRDGGTSFQKLTAGLPPVPAFHLVYRHGLCIDDTGEQLAMGSTTGSLWVSANAGDNWTRLSAELPQIYCVSFA